MANLHEVIQAGTLQFLKSLALPGHPADSGEPPTQDLCLVCDEIPHVALHAVQKVQSDQPIRTRNWRMLS